MVTLYWALFCLGIAGIILWALRDDDFPQFSGLAEAQNKKFRVQRPNDRNVEEGTGHE